MHSLLKLLSVVFASTTAASKQASGQDAVYQENLVTGGGLFNRQRGNHTDGRKPSNGTN
ncbi:hypothetical protein M9458_044197, partial [Cirrhinus mrigala]